MAGNLVTSFSVPHSGAIVRSYGTRRGTAPRRPAKTSLVVPVRSGGTSGRSPSDGSSLMGELAKKGKKNASPDVMKVFAKAQENMMMLNQSRLKALEDLQVARDTISDLKSQLQEANEELKILRASGDQMAAIEELRSQLQEANEELELLKLADDQLTTIEGLRSQLQKANTEVEQLKSAGSTTDMPAPTPSQPAPTPAAPAMTGAPGQASVAAPPTPEPPAESASTQYINLYYKTGWRKAFIHCCVDGKSWTQVPGLKMTDDGECKKMVFKGSSMEFVVNNGGDNWDKLDPYSDSGPKNYSIKSPGTYYLASGVLKKTA
mmetsp:Transcript_30421/g.76681  ORF Transcript_30421/g.76681 Transcript_30421/m.76681 type:complete len:320 (-) Transcript_30421:3686-4645(-)